MTYISVDVDLEDYLDEFSAYDLVHALKLKARELDADDIRYLKEVLLKAGQTAEIESLEESLKYEEWNAVKDQMTSMQWREFFQERINQQNHRKTGS